MSDVEKKSVEPGEGSSILSLLKLLLNYKLPLGIGIIGLIGVNTLQLSIPKIIQYAINKLAQGSESMTYLYGAAGLIAFAAIGIVGCRFVWRYFLVGTGMKIDRDLRQRLYDHLQTLPPEYYDHQKVGDITAHATNDVNAIRRSISFGTLSAIDAIFMGLGAFVLMLHTDIKLTLLTLLPLPPMAIIVRYFGRIIHERYKHVQEAFSSMTESAQETISGIRVVKAYGDQETAYNHFGDRAKKYVKENIRLVIISAIMHPVIMALVSSSMVLMLAIGGSMIITGKLRLGDFVALQMLLAMLTWPMIAIGVVVNLLERGAASMARINKIMNTQPSLLDGPLDIDPEPVISVDRLSYTYPETDVEVLKDIKFELKPNTTLGIVGLTGSGKTTLVELCMRLYEPPTGTVRIEGHDVRDMKMNMVRGMFGYVPQEPFLFAISIAENIRFGNPDITDDEVREIAEIASIHDEISDFPDGYETIVGERGVTLSGGQKQRVAIARALALRPKILVLDDALSAVDAETEAAILSNLSKVIKGNTNIIIAHRVSAVRNADMILVLENGRVTDKGTHFELIQRSDYYSELYHLQKLEEEQMQSMEEQGGEA
jgi:ATP-binding cassette subfamily B protein